MEWKLKIKEKVKKDLNKIPVKYQKKILEALPLITGNPFLGKKLKGEISGLYSYRVWPYRIIYKIYKSMLIVVVIEIGHRQGIYD